MHPYFASFTKKEQLAASLKRKRLFLLVVLNNEAPRELIFGRHYTMCMGSVLCVSGICEYCSNVI